MVWMVFGIIFGSYAEFAALGYGLDSWSLMALLTYVYLVMSAPAIGSFVVVVQ
jgi:hypothetical protein